jgi:hypothetical protein
VISLALWLVSESVAKAVMWVAGSVALVALAVLVILSCLPDGIERSDG